ncbi:MAG: efflux RND transporter periplasmic adaptor subunit [Pelomonas sp.]|nr:efflux RND transporter periplasmic adaptor subunit [Roseateles sp.]
MNDQTMQSTSLRDRLAGRAGFGLAALALAVLVLRMNHSAVADDGAAAAKAKAAPVPIVSAAVQQQTLPVERTGLGQVLAGVSVTVHTRIDGELETVNYREGEDVRKGALLARLDDRMIVAQLQQAEAAQQRDEAQLANAQVDLRRFRTLVPEKAATQQQLDTQEALVRQLQAAIANDAAAVAAARVQLSYTRITAPSAGRAGARLVDPGNIVHAADPGGLVVINEIDPIQVQFTLPQEDFQAVNAAINASKGRALTVQASDRDTHAVLATGQLSLLNNQIDVSTGTVLLKARFTNPQHRLWPGQTVDARLVLGTQADTLTVPVAAIQRTQQGLMVYVVDAGNTVRVQAVTVASSDDKIARISKGVKLGERVVVDGQYRLFPGASVQERPPETAAKGGAASAAASR